MAGVSFIQKGKPTRLLCLCEPKRRHSMDLKGDLQASGKRAFSIPVPMPFCELILSRCPVVCKEHASLPSPHWRGVSVVSGVTCWTCCALLTSE